MNDLIIILMGMVVMQCLLIAVYLFKKGKKEHKTTILFLLMVTIAFHFSNLILGKIVPDYGGYVLSWMLLLLYGPLLFNYVQCFTSSNYNSNFHYLVASYPLILWVFTDKLHRESSDDIYFDIWVSFPVYTVFLAYLIASLIAIFAMPDKSISIRWLKYLVFSFASLVLTHLIVLLAYSKGGGVLANILYLIEVVYMLFFVSGIVFTAMSKPVVFGDINSIIGSVTRPPKYFYTNLSKEAAYEILERLESYMKNEKAYLDPSQNLDRLSAILGIKKRHISQVINEHLQINFKEYVNRYRIRHAIDLLDQHTNDIRIFEVMYDVGFNSKSAFNTAFKKYTGNTPTNYRENLLSQDKQRDKLI